MIVIAPLTLLKNLEWLLLPFPALLSTVTFIPSQTHLSSYATTVPHCSLEPLYQLFFQGAHSGFPATCAINTEVPCILPVSKYFLSQGQGWPCGFRYGVQALANGMEGVKRTQAQ